MLNEKQLKEKFFNLQKMRIDNPQKFLTGGDKPIKYVHVDYFSPEYADVYLWDKLSHGYKCQDCGRIFSAGEVQNIKVREWMNSNSDTFSLYNYPLYIIQSDYDKLLSLFYELKSLICGIKLKYRCRSCMRSDRPAIELLFIMDYNSDYVITAFDEIECQFKKQTLCKDKYGNYYNMCSFWGLEIVIRFLCEDLEKLCVYDVDVMDEALKKILGLENFVNKKELLSKLYNRLFYWDNSDFSLDFLNPELNGLKETDDVKESSEKQFEKEILACKRRQCLRLLRTVKPILNHFDDDSKFGFAIYRNLSDFLLSNYKYILKETKVDKKVYEHIEKILSGDTLGYNELLRKRPLTVG